MDLITIAKGAGAVLGAIGGPSLIAKAVRAAVPDRRKRLRDEIERNVALLEKLPSEAVSRANLLDVIDEDVTTLTTQERLARRDPVGITLGVVFLVGGAASVWGAWDVSGWWQIPLWILAGVLLLIGAIGFGVSVRSRVRDEKGNALPDEPESE